MNRNTVIGLVSVVILGICSLFACVGVGAFMYQDELQAYLGLQTSQKTAALLPTETEFYLAMTPNIQAVSGYENLKTLYLDNPKIKALLQKTEKEITKDNFDFQTQMLPWLGTEIVLAIPKFSTVVAAQNRNTPPDFILSFQSRDRTASDQFIANEVATSAKTGSMTDETYQGVTLHIRQETTGDYKETVLVGLNDLVIFGSSTAMIKDMIDRSQGSNAPAFINNAAYNKIAAELPPNAIANLYIKTNTLIEAIFKEGEITLPETTLKEARSVEALGVAMLLQPNGLQFENVLSYDLSQMSATTKNALQYRNDSPNAILEHIPADALVVLNSFNLNEVWQNVKTGMKANPDFEMQLADMETSMGFSVDEDIFSWMTGEYALVLVDTPKQTAFTPRGGGYVLIGSDDIATAKTHVDKVAAGFTQSMGPFIVLKPQTIQGIELTAPENPLDPSFSMGYGFHDNYFVAAYREEAVSALVAAKQGNLVNQAQFKAIQAQLPAKNVGYMYANLGKTRPVIESYLNSTDKTEYETSVQPFLEPVQAIGVAGSIDGFDKGLSRSSVFLLISK